MRRLDVITEPRVIYGATREECLSQNRTIVRVRLGEWLQQFDVYDPKGDGNCFFRGLSKAECGSEDYHIDIRLKTLLHMISNSQHYSIDDIKQVGEIGRGVTFAGMIATARTMRRNIFLYHTLDRLWYTFCGREDSIQYQDDEFNRYFVATYVSQVHGHIYGVLKCQPDCSLGAFIENAENQDTSRWNQDSFQTSVTDVASPEQLKAIVISAIDSLMYQEKEIFVDALKLDTVPTQMLEHIEPQLPALFFKYVTTRNFRSLHDISSLIVDRLTCNDCDIRDKGFLHVIYIKSSIENMVKEMRGGSGGLEEFLNTTEREGLLDGDKKRSICDEVIRILREGANISLTPLVPA